MRHRKSGRKFGRTHDQRLAMFRNLAKSLVTHGRIRTTEAKAKELRRMGDKLVALGLRNDVHARRQAYQILGNHQLVKRLFDDIAPAFVGVGGGFTRVVKLSQPRTGDSAPMAIIEFSRVAGEEAPAPKAKKAAPAAAPEAPAEAPAEEAAAEAPAEEAAAEAEAPAEEAAAEAAPEAEAAAEPEAETEAPAEAKAEDEETK